VRRLPCSTSASDLFPLLIPLCFHFISACTATSDSTSVRFYRLSGFWSRLSPRLSQIKEDVFPIPGPQHPQLLISSPGSSIQRGRSFPAPGSPTSPASKVLNTQHGIPFRSSGLRSPTFYPSITRSAIWRLFRVRPVCPGLAFNSGLIPSNLPNHRYACSKRRQQYVHCPRYA
jgi:hypothetical protein